MHSYGRRVAILSVLALSTYALAIPGDAMAQGTERRWEVEGFGGGLFTTGSSNGTTMLPPPGAPIATASPIFPSRRVPSWLLGDGTALLNGVNQQFGVAALIQPLDAALNATAIDSGNGFATGARVRRWISSRLAIEGALDMFVGSTNLSDDLLTAADASRASFGPAFEGLLSSGPFSDVNVSTTSTTGGSGTALAVTGALVYHLAEPGGWVPYLTFGGGVISGLGSGSVTLEGNYSFQILGEVPINETDQLTVRADHRTVPAGLVGAGLRRDISASWGFRIDGRVLISPNSARLLIDSAPSVAEGTPADFVESFTVPSIQFSNSASTGRESSLGDPGLDGFEAFVADGMQTRILVSAGVFFKF